MKKYLFLALAALLSVSVSVSAQNSNKNRQGKTGQRGNKEMTWTAKDRAEKMDKELDLTDAQVSQLIALFEKHDAKRIEQREAMKAQREQGSTADRAKNREEMRAQREKEIAAFEADVEKIIGKEKADKWQTLRQKQGRNQRNSRR